MEAEEETHSQDDLSKPVTVYDTPRNIVAYHTFPSRTIIQSPFQKPIALNYGIVAFAWDTRRWMLVQASYTCEFLRILGGTYRNAELPRLLKHITIQELASLQKLSKSSFHFNALFCKVFPHKGIEELVYAKERFLSNGMIFLHYDICRDQPASIKWQFPYSSPLGSRENSVDCALRAFKDYTGLDITHREKSFLGRDPFCEKAPNIHEGQRSEIRYWLVIYMAEPRLRSNRPFKSQESVKMFQSKWSSEEEVIEVLEPPKQAILREAKELIRENLLL